MNLIEIEKTAKKEFAESKDLQSEFKGDETTYVAFKKAEAEGRVGVIRGKMEKVDRQLTDLGQGKL